MAALDRQELIRLYKRLDLQYLLLSCINWVICVSMFLADFVNPSWSCIALPLKAQWSEAVWCWAAEALPLCSVTWINRASGFGWFCFIYHFYPFVWLSFFGADEHMRAEEICFAKVWLWRGPQGTAGSRICRRAVCSPWLRDIFLADVGFVQGVFEMMQQFDWPEFAADITFLQQERGVVLHGFAWFCTCADTLWYYEGNSLIC